MPYISYIATRIHNAACLLAKGLRESGNDVQTDKFFDTLKVSPRLDITEIKHRANEMKINFRYFPDESVGISLGETIERKDVRDILWVFGTPKVTKLPFILNQGTVGQKILKSPGQKNS